MKKKWESLGFDTVGGAASAVLHLKGHAKTQQDLSFFTQCLSALSFVWFGMVMAISFMESWVKFTAPTMPREVGLDVGRTVFAALNRVEIIWSVLSFLLVQEIFYCHQDLHNPLAVHRIVLLVLPFVILAIQTLHLQPVLDRRARLIMTKQPLEGGAMPHHLYIILEVVKVVALFTNGLAMFSL